MISSFDGKLKRQIYDYTDKLKDQVLYLAPEVIFQVCLKKFRKNYFYLSCRIKMGIILKVIFIV